MNILLPFSEAKTQVRKSEVSEEHERIVKSKGQKSESKTSPKSQIQKGAHERGQDKTSITQTNNA